MKRHYVGLILIALLTLTGSGTALADNPNPQVIPDSGHLYQDLSIKFWLYALSFPAKQVPFFNTGGPVNLRAGQSGNTWLLAGNSAPLTQPRTATIPAGTYLFFPLANVLYDYPCPDPTFGPAPGETLEHFLQTGGDKYLPHFTDLFAEIDGSQVPNPPSYRVISSMFQFTADPALAKNWDSCITGTPQYGVSVGYWLLLAPLSAGQHTLHFGTPSWGQDITYILTVKPN